MKGRPKGANIAAARRCGAPPATHSQGPRKNRLQCGGKRERHRANLACRAAVRGLTWSAFPAFTAVVGAKMCLPVAKGERAVLAVVHPAQSDQQRHCAGWRPTAARAKAPRASVKEVADVRRCAVVCNEGRTQRAGRESRGRVGTPRSGPRRTVAAWVRLLSQSWETRRPLSLTENRAVGRRGETDIGRYHRFSLAIGHSPLP